MATTSLIDNFRALAVQDDSDETLSHARCLPFNPGPDFGISSERLGKVDRYLFRLFDTNSDGSMDSKWVKSKDADKTKFKYYKDVFARQDLDNAAQALRRHLQWKGQPDEEDNFVSWSSSLLVVLQYAHYRTRHFPNNDFGQIFLCVVDTTLLPTNVFMRDLDLLTAFSGYDNSHGQDTLPRLLSLRRKRHATYQGSYDFGEYLSQGALCIEDCCSIVPIAYIINNGLYLLKADLKDPATTKEKWANRVIRMREPFYESSTRHLAHPFELEHALRIGGLFGSSWKVPIALAFLALKPRRMRDDTMVEECRPLYSRGPEAFQLSPEATVILSNNALPEVQQFDRLRRCLYKDAILITIQRKCEKANAELRHAFLLAKEIPQLGLEAVLRIQSQPHYAALDAVTQTTQELEEALSVMLEREE